MLRIVSTCLLLGGKGRKMKLKYSLETVEMENEIVAVPVGESARNMRGVLKLNEPGKEICELLKKDISEKEIIDQLDAVYENDRNNLEGLVHNFIEQMRGYGMLDE